MSKKTDLPFVVHCTDVLTGATIKVRDASVRLIVEDPPYNLGQKYANYVDRKTQAEFIQYIGKRIGAQLGTLTPDGSVWVLINDANISELDVYCKQELGLYPRDKVVWHYTFGQNHAKGLTPSHCTWLWYSNHKTKFVFNADAIRVPSARQLVYNDKRSNPRGRLPDNCWVLRPQEILDTGFQPDMETWFYSRVCGTFKAKVKEAGIPNQLPRAMLERIIKLCSDPGDLVFDGFCGTGTTGMAAVGLDRRFVGMDISNKCVAYSRKRIQDAMLGLSDKDAAGQGVLFPASGSATRRRITNKTYRANSECTG